MKLKLWAGMPARIARWIAFACFSCTVHAVPPTDVPLRIAFVSHAPDSDVWWNVIRHALADAGADFGVEVDYLNPADGRLENMARIIDGLSPQKYVAVISTIADAHALDQPLRGVVQRKRLPLITVNSGTQVESERIGALMHVGQPEFTAGQEAGERARKAGVRSFVCLNHYATHPASTERCKGFAAGLGTGAGADTLVLDGTPEAMERRVRNYLEQHPQTEAMLALGPTSAHAALGALKSLPLPPGKPYFATFDLSAPITQAIKSGTIAFAIDQQPYAQGYLPVALLAEHARASGERRMRLTQYIVYANEKLHARMSRYGIELKPTGGTHINSGPGFVTKVNIEKVERYSGRYR